MTKTALISEAGAGIIEAIISTGSREKHYGKYH